MATWQQMYPKLAAAVAANPNAPGAATMLSGWLANGVDPADPAVADWMNANESAISASSPQGNFAGNPFDGYPALKAYFAQFPNSPMNWTNSDTGQIAAIPGLADQLEKSAEMVYQQNGVPVGGQLPASVGKIQSLQNGDALQQTYTTGPGAGNFNTTGGNAFGALQSTLADIKTPLMIAGLMMGGGSLLNGLSAGGNTLGLTQMGQAAGLSGQALSDFVASGGAMGSTAAGGGGIGLGAASGAASTLPASYWNTVAGDIPSGGISSLTPDANTLGLQQMGQAAGLQGQALTDFVNSGGTLGSTAAGGGGVGLGAANALSGLPNIPPGASTAVQQLIKALGSGGTPTGTPTGGTNGGGTTGGIMNPDGSINWGNALGALGTAGIGLATADANRSANNAAADKMLALGAPARGALNNAIADPNNFYNSAPAMGAADAAARALSVQGNPAWNPTSSAKLAAYNLGGYNQYLGALTQAGNIGVANANAPNLAAANTANTAGASLAGGLASALGTQGLSSLTSYLNGTSGQSSDPYGLNALLNIPNSTPSTMTNMTGFTNNVGTFGGGTTTNPADPYGLNLGNSSSDPYGLNLGGFAA